MIIVFYIVEQTFKAKLKLETVNLNGTLILNIYCCCLSKENFVTSYITYKYTLT